MARVIYSTFQKYVKHSRALIEKFVTQEYNKNTFRTPTEIANYLERLSLLKKLQSPKQIMHPIFNDKEKLEKEICY